jgi:hypothetical protein
MEYKAVFEFDEYKFIVVDLDAKDICDARNMSFEIVKNEIYPLNIISCQVIEVNESLTCDIKDWEKRIVDTQYDKEQHLKEEKECEELKEFVKNFDL